MSQVISSVKKSSNTFEAFDFSPYIAEIQSILSTCTTEDIMRSFQYHLDFDNQSAFLKRLSAFEDTLIYNIIHELPLSQQMVMYYKWKIADDICKNKEIVGFVEVVINQCLEDFLLRAYNYEKTFLKTSSKMHIFKKKFS